MFLLRACYDGKIFCLRGLLIVDVYYFGSTSGWIDDGLGWFRLTVVRGCKMAQHDRSGLSEPGRFLFPINGCRSKQPFPIVGRDPERHDNIAGRASLSPRQYREFDNCPSAP